MTSLRYGLVILEGGKKENVDAVQQATQVLLRKSVLNRAMPSCYLRATLPPSHSFYPSHFIMHGLLALQLDRLCCFPSTFSSCYSITPSPDASGW